jgi:predicted RNase H-like HicB family nuclease
MSDIEGKVTRVGASERGQRTSFKIDCRITERVSIKTNEHEWSSLICGLPASSEALFFPTMKLRLVVECDPQTKRWAAFFPELPGCASAGDTEEEAVRNAKEALDLWFEPASVTFPAGAKVLEVALK